MTAYSEELNKISRTPVTLIVMTLDFCGRTFGTSPCLATGAPCYNTFPTCKYKSAYLKQSKDYKFTSTDAPLPFKLGERPYIKSIKYLPTEIKDNLTINARITAELYDETDTDIGIDPYVSQRSSVQGTFFKKLIARNPNYKGRPVKTYEGFLGLLEADFQQKFVGVLDNITLDRGDTVKLEIVDILKSLTNIEVPPKLDIKLLADIDASVVDMTLTTVTGLDSPSGYVRIKDEIIYYTGVNGTTNQITGCTRGYFSTTAATHKADDKVQKIRYYPPANGFNILKEMLLTDAGITSSYVDSTGFDYWRDWPGGEVDFTAIISEPTKLDKLYFEVVDLLDCKSWVAEDLKITIKRNIPNEPGRGYNYITDEANIIKDSVTVDLNAKSRISRVLLYWQKSTLSKIDDVASYDRLDIAVDADAESANEYNESIEKKLFCRWLKSGYIQEELLHQYIKNFLARRLFAQRDPMPIITVSLEMKDSGIKTGEYIKLTNNDLLDIEGNSLIKETFQVVKRELNDKREVLVKALKITPKRLGFIAPDTVPDYDSASDADKEYCYICQDDGLMPDGSQGYFIY